MCTCVYFVQMYKTTFAEQSIGKISRMVQHNLYHISSQEMFLRISQVLTRDSHNLHKYLLTLLEQLTTFIIYRTY